MTPSETYKYIIASKTRCGDLGDIELRLVLEPGLVEDGRGRVHLVEGAEASQIALLR